MARRMAAEARGAGQPLRWFEPLYAAARSRGTRVPWADLKVNPHVATWPGWAAPGAGGPARVCVVGCGYGDDAEWIAERGHHVTAFDISTTAIAHCRDRFPRSQVNYHIADLLDPPVIWLTRPFDLVVEAYTVQVLPPGTPERAGALAALAALTGTTLLLVGRGRDDGDDPGSMPWPLTRPELDLIVEAGLRESAFEDYLDDEDRPVRRFRVTYTRPPAG